MKQHIERFWREEDGITALEYGILAAIILVAVAALALFIANQLNPNTGAAGTLGTRVKDAIATTSST